MEKVKLSKNRAVPAKVQDALKKSKKIQVTIPAGVDTGTRLRISGEGEGGYRGGSPGDLYVEIRVKDSDKYERHGSDLHTILKSTLCADFIGRPD